MAENVSANDIVPESYQMRLMMWRDEFTRGYFEIGDISNEIVMLNIQKGMKIDQNIIYSAIGKFCGKSGRTVRDYAEVAAFFPPNVRDEYEVLPFSHFRYAKSCGLKYQDVLNLSLGNPSMSVDALEAKINCRPVPYKDSVEEPEPQESPRVVVQSASEIIALGNLISQTEKLLSWNIDRKIREELMLSLGGLKHVLSCLSSKDEKAMRFEYNNCLEE